MEQDELDKKPQEIFELDIPFNEKIWMISENLSPIQNNTLVFDFIEHALENYEKKFPGDDRPRKDVKKNRKIIANGEDLIRYSLVWTALATSALALVGNVDAKIAEQNWQKKRILEFLGYDG